MTKTRVTFTTPIPYGDGKLSSIGFRHPTAGDLRGLKLGGLGDMDVDLVLKIATRLADQPVTEAQLWQLMPADFLRLTQAVVDFFTDADPSPTTQPAPGA